MAYARVSSHDQKSDLLVQAERLHKHCEAHGWDTEVLTDLGSGMSYRKLLAAILAGHVERLVIVTKDRLPRFGAELAFSICALRGVEVVVLDAVKEVPRAQQLTEDLVEILTVFSSRLYGSHSRKNLKAVAAEVEAR